MTAVHISTNVKKIWISCTLKCPPSKKFDTKEGKTVGFFFEEEPVVAWTGDKPPGARSTGEAKYSVGEIDYKECPIMLDKPRTVIVAYP
ncbi:hypothetical protein PRIPAC_74266 [Pristionchus pacificus]|uniref:Uncharacterized protein n=1 Tax=Pristionchus pacificus TaxID=54126 RepID=A0A2A6C8L0_PRIPA|nr:hypothetical protein PRIPAC_74266 [Pristionchus pacificus]|eukprot:PDM74436.1 hypothetical protein PRIPAC_41792 [Pristionchus pacificus]